MMKCLIYFIFSDRETEIRELKNALDSAKVQNATIVQQIQALQVSEIVGRDIMALYTVLSLIELIIE